VPALNNPREELRTLVSAVRAHMQWREEIPSLSCRYTSSQPEQVLTLDEIQRRLGACQRCPLHATRNTIVFGEGNPHAPLVFVGEAPGADEDRLGRPFVGKAGQLLTKIIEAMGLTREDVYICNVLKCRPPGNRTPLPEEVESCRGFLEQQLEVIKPEVICALGSSATRALLKTEAPITALRGKYFEYRGIPCVPTYHPAYLLRNPAAKRYVWEDMKGIMGRLRLKT